MQVFRVKIWGKRIYLSIGLSAVFSTIFPCNFEPPLTQADDIFCCCCQCDQIGRFAYKTILKILVTFWLFWNMLNCCGYYFGNFFTTTPGHTGCCPKITQSHWPTFNLIQQGRGGGDGVKLSCHQIRENVASYFLVYRHLDKFAPDKWALLR